MPNNEVWPQSMEVFGTVHVTYICMHFGDVWDQFVLESGTRI